MSHIHDAHPTARPYADTAIYGRRNGVWPWDAFILWEGEANRQATNSIFFELELEIRSYRKVCTPSVPVARVRVVVVRLWHVAAAVTVPCGCGKEVPPGPRLARREPPGQAHIHIPYAPHAAPPSYMEYSAWRGSRPSVHPRRAAPWPWRFLLRTIGRKPQEAARGQCPTWSG